ncbi:MAG: S8 family serine peptidase [Bacteroidota bacterium]
MHRSNVLNAYFSSGRNYDGSGINVLCRDDGLVGPHIDFKGRINNEFVENPSSPGGSHGDGVSGIMAGAGNLNPRNKGMAPGANLYVIDYESDFLDETMQLHINEDVLITNSSYSNGCNTGYTLVTETIDQQLFEYPKLMHVFSAGNSNQLDCGYGAGNQWGNITGGHKQAKNCITVANLNADGSLAEASSRGPAHDGRIKPDIAAFGEGQISTDGDNTYQTFGGTSAAAPGVAGVLAQLQQAYKSLNNEIPADAALLKAAILNSADDLGNPGPDFKYGWGKINALRAVKIIEENNYLKSSVIPLENKINELFIPANIIEARVMLYWHDQEAANVSLKALINNLDLKVIDPLGNEFFPWTLNPVADPNILDQPATFGIDDLNNMEQVFLKNPMAGNYKIEVSGKEMPLGQLPFYLVWEFRTNDLKLTYPFGGESFEPNETVQMAWDGVPSSSDLIISISTDGTASFENVATVPGNINSFEWTIPNKISGECYIKIENIETGKSSLNQVPFSIAPSPKNLNVIQACPAYLKINWDAVDFGNINSAIIYEIFLLGEKSMEKIGSTALLEFQVPTIENDPTNDHWIAVRATVPNTIYSERSSAILYNGGLLQCEQEHDLTVVSINSPKEGIVFGCGTESIPVEIEIKNNGLSTESNFLIGYQADNSSPVLETFNGDLMPGEIQTFIFSNEINVSGSTAVALRVFTELHNDSAEFNNEKNVTFSLALYDGIGETLDYFEDFNTPFLPPYYAIVNPDDDLTWSNREVIGVNGLSTQSMFINNYSYSSIGEEDAFLVVPIDLTEAQLPLLSFDVAYAQYSDNYSDGLRIEISKDCGHSFEQIIYEKQGTELATAPNHNQLFLPESGSEWRRESISLNYFIGHSIVLKFININGYGNSLFIDNLNIKEEILLPVANISASSTKICEGAKILFSDQSVGTNLSYVWNFGENANPQFYYGPGPVEVEFPEAGLHPVTLSVDNSAGTSSFTQIIEVQAPAEPAFEFQVDNLEVTFSNESKNAVDYFWQFGDGNTSTAFSPVHHYLSAGNFAVSLTAKNICGDFIQEKELSIILNNLFEKNNNQHVQLFPNPANQIVNVLILNNNDPLIKICLKNITGQVIRSTTVERTTDHAEFSFGTDALSDGIYFMEIIFNERSEVLKFVIDH